MAASYLSLTINGAPVEDVLLSSVKITQELNHHAWSKIRCRRTEDERFPIEAWLGKDLQIICHDDQDAERMVFDGFILEVELDYEIYGSYAARLKGVTRSYKMDLTPRHAYYTEKTLSAIANQLAGPAGLQANVLTGNRKPLNYVQWGETDWAFLNRIVDDHEAWIRPTAHGFDICNSFQSEVPLEWREDGAGLLDFKMRGVLAQPSVSGAHYDLHKMESKVFTKISDTAQFFGSSGPLVAAVQSESQKLPPDYAHQRARITTLEEYEKLLKKQSVRSIGSSIAGIGTSRNQNLQPGDKTSIQGVLDAQGIYGLVKVVHHWTKEGYWNKFRCTPWQNYTNREAPEFEPWYGVVPARVVEHNDPKKMGRLKVRYFWQEDGTAHWARMITLHAGGNRGFMFMPEVGDEVAVAFEDGDPERPYILGCVWNGVDMAPRHEFWGGDIAPNDVKRIVTKSGNHIQMVDKPGKESIVIGTPNSIRVALIANANETNRETLLLESSKGDIILNAPEGRIHFHSKYLSREVGPSADDTQGGSGGSADGRKDEIAKQIEDAQKQQQDQLQQQKDAQKGG
jgi:type VI secretion system secreted protein VgrG